MNCLKFKETNPRTSKSTISRMLALQVTIPGSSLVPGRSPEHCQEGSLNTRVRALLGVALANKNNSKNKNNNIQEQAQRKGLKVKLCKGALISSNPL